MAFKFLKDNLPWIAPTVAIVFAASGYFDRQYNAPQVAQSAPAQPVPVQPMPIAQAQTSIAALTPAPAVAPRFDAGIQPAGIVQQTAPLASQIDVVTRLNAAVAPSFDGLVSPQVAPEPTAPVEAMVTPPEPQVVEPVVQEPRVALAPTSTENAAAFFNAAQARIAAEASCVDDIRNLTESAVVHFPSGGLSADEGGILQARLIGRVADRCPGVMIRVEGHSDASGNPISNKRLSLERAEYVIKRLDAAGVDVRAFVAEGFGSSQPSSEVGPKSRAFYDRRVEFSIVETGVAPTNSFSPRVTAGRTAQCVIDLQNAVIAQQLFYGPRAISAGLASIEPAIELAQRAAACPQARLRVIGHHSSDPVLGETPETARLRAKVLMSMMVSRGIDSEQIIIAAPSRSEESATLSGSRVEFDVIVE